MQERTRAALNAEKRRRVSLCGMGKRKTLPATPERIERGKRIALALEDAGKLQTDLAAELGVSNPTVHDWVSGTVTPRPHRLVEIGRFLHCSVDWLLLKDDEMEFDVASNLTRFGLAIGREGLEFIGELSADEQREMVERYEVHLARRKRTRRRAESAKTLAKTSK